MWGGKHCSDNTGNITNKTVFLQRLLLGGFISFLLQQGSSSNSLQLFKADTSCSRHELSLTLLLTVSLRRSKQIISSDRYPHMRCVPAWMGQITHAMICHYFITRGRRKGINRKPDPIVNLLAFSKVSKPPILCNSVSCFASTVPVYLVKGWNVQTGN